MVLLGCFGFGRGTGQGCGQVTDVQGVLELCQWGGAADMDGQGFSGEEVEGVIRKLCINIAKR